MVEEGVEESSYGSGDRLNFITYKGGPGAFCGGNSREHRKCKSHWKGGGGGPTVGEVFEWGKEGVGIAQCAYELATLKGACPKP